MKTEDAGKKAAEAAASREFALLAELMGSSGPEVQEAEETGFGVPTLELYLDPDSHRDLLKPLPTWAISSSRRLLRG